MDAEGTSTVKLLVEAPAKTGTELTRELVAVDYDLKAHKDSKAPAPITTWTPNGDWYEDGKTMKLEFRVAYENKGHRRICKVFARLTAIDPVSAMKVKHAAFRQLLASEADEIEMTKRRFALEVGVENPHWQLWIDGVKQVPLAPRTLAERDMPKLSDALGVLATALEEDADLKSIVQHLRTARGRLVRAIDELAKVSGTAAAV
jgi:hypothetical protein